MKLISIILIICLAITLLACEEEWLDVRRDKKQVVPQTLKDLQALMDNVLVMNYSITSFLGEAGTDDYYVTDASWESMSSGAARQQRQAYSWTAPFYEADNSTTDWNGPYKAVFYANVALEGVEKIKPLPSEQKMYNNIKGSALFFRAWAFYQLAQVFCKSYNAATATTDAGLPLRLESDVNIVSKRATVQQTYDRILADIKAAISLLPDQPVEKTRPAKASAFALLAKAYLQMEDYENALEAAGQSLSFYSTLIDYNTIDEDSNAPFDKLNDETIYYDAMNYVSSGTLGNAHHIVAPGLYDSYDENDLRKTVFFYNDNGNIRYKGSYDGGGFFGMYFFSGIATDEVYLMRAECYARTGKVQNAMDDLNYLLSMRYEQGTFIPVAASDADEALMIILKERRKELVFRGIRWSDLRRLNKDPRFKKTLTRELNDQVYTLAPGDPRYVLPIPELVINLSGISQNPR